MSAKDIKMKSHEDCEVCNDQNEKEIDRKRRNEEYIESLRRRRAKARKEFLEMIFATYGLNEEDSYDVYNLWEEFIDND